jgi:hypothetical protein
VGQGCSVHFYWLPGVSHNVEDTVSGDVLHGGPRPRLANATHLIGDISHGR